MITLWTTQHVQKAFELREIPFSRWPEDAQLAAKYILCNKTWKREWDELPHDQRKDWLVGKVESTMKLCEELHFEFVLIE
jgi:hypothetical protein